MLSQSAPKVSNYVKREDRITNCSSIGNNSNYFKLVFNCCHTWPSSFLLAILETVLNHPKRNSLQKVRKLTRYVHFGGMSIKKVNRLFLLSKEKELIQSKILHIYVSLPSCSVKWGFCDGETSLNLSGREFPLLLLSAAHVVSKSSDLRQTDRRID